MTRHPLILRLIHWFTALMFIPMLAGGWFWLRTMSSADAFKLDALMYHMAIGVFLVALTALRLVLRWRMAHPQADGLALWAHRALYLCVFLMPVSGFTMVFSARLNDIVFARNGAPLPADMATITGHFWHGLTAAVLTGLIALHILGAFKDRTTIRRMI
jgi:cytochrome b561